MNHHKVTIKRHQITIKSHGRTSTSPGPRASPGGQRPGELRGQEAIAPDLRNHVNQMCMPLDMCVYIYIYEVQYIKMNQELRYV